MSEALAINSPKLNISDKIDMTILSIPIDVYTSNYVLIHVMKG